MDECEHGGDPHSCPPCQRKAGRLDPLQAPEPEEFFFTARFDGLCGRCNLPIHKGQRCVHLASGNVHAMCSD